TEIDQLVADTFFGQHSWKDSNLSAVRDLLTKRAPKGFENEVLTTYRQIRRGRRAVPDEERSQTKSHLKLVGIVHRDDRGILRPGNPIYQRVFDDRWVKEHLKVNWTRRLMYAVAFLIVTLLSVSIPVSIYALNSKKEADHQRDRAEQALQEKEQALQEEAKARKVAD